MLCCTSKGILHVYVYTYPQSKFTRVSSFILRFLPSHCLCSCLSQGGGGGGKGAIDTSHFGHGQQILLSSPALLFLRTPCQALMFPPILNRCQCLFLSSFPNAPCFLLSSFYDDGSFFSCSIAVSVFPYPLFFQCSSLPSFLLPLVLCE